MTVKTAAMASLLSFAFVVPRAAAQETPVLATIEETRDLHLEDETSRRALEGAQRDRELVSAYHVLEVATAVSLGLTALGGLVQAYNLPTSFGEGACLSENNDAIFGDYACRQSLSTIHGVAAITSITLYTATGVTALFAPDEEGPEDVVTDVLGWVHTVGIALTGALGLVSRYPDLIGVDSAEDRYDFSRHMRTVHVGLALTTAAAFITHVLVDLID